jgi:hypothetical protein
MGGTGKLGAGWRRRNSYNGPRSRQQIRQALRPLLFAAILTDGRNSELRDAVRCTWLGQMQRPVTEYTFIGWESAMLQREATIHGDVTSAPIPRTVLDAEAYVRNLAKSLGLGALAAASEPVVLTTEERALLPVMLSDKLEILSYPGSKMRCTSHSKLRYISHLFSQCDVRRIGLWGVAPGTKGGLFRWLFCICLGASRKLT